MNNNKLNPRQKKAVAAFLEEPTVGAAAQAAGVTENTLVRWLDRDQQFIGAVRKARQCAVERAIGRLADAAVDAAEALANDPGVSAQVRFRAATTLLTGLDELRI